MDNFNNDMTNLPLGLAFGMAMEKQSRNGEAGTRTGRTGKLLLIR